MDCIDETKSSSKDKLRSIMDAASALTALADDDNETESTDVQKKASTSGLIQANLCQDTVNPGSSSKRFLPENKKPDAAFTFPEKLMCLMKYANTKEKDFCVSWLPDGKSFIIKNPDDFTRNVVPRFFKSTKFTSFTRKLYRWGFRQINRGIGPDDPIIFGNEYFDRDAPHLISQMRSITAAGMRKNEHFSNFVKRPVQVKADEPTPKKAMLAPKAEEARTTQTSERPVPVLSAQQPPTLSNPYSDEASQRLLFDQLVQQKAACLLQLNPTFYGNLNGYMPLTSALQQNIGFHPSIVTNNGIALNKFETLTPQHQLLLQQHPTSLLSHFGLPNQNLVSAPYASSQSTAEIVNAAIAALRFAN